MSNEHARPHTDCYHGPFSCVETPKVETAQKPESSDRDTLRQLEDEYRARYKSAAEWGGRGIF